MSGSRQRAARRGGQGAPAFDAARGVAASPRARDGGPSSSRRAPARGFTLLEVLVAVALFAVAAALAFGGLDALTRARSRLDAGNERLGRLQFAVGLLERDLRSAAARGVRDGYGAPLPALLGTRERVELTRHGHANALARPRAELERVGYRLRSPD